MPEITFIGSGKTRNAILAALAKRPGQTAEELAKVINTTVGATRSALTQLAKNTSTVARYRKGRDYVYALAQQVHVAVKEPEAVSADIAALQAKVAELEEFKAKALAEHPDLDAARYEQYRNVLAVHYEFIQHYGSAELLREGASFDEEDIELIEHIVHLAQLVNEAEQRA